MLQVYLIPAVAGPITLVLLTIALILLAYTTLPQW